jgi:hypothetical protein
MAQITLLDAMAIDANGNPTSTFTPEIISTSPFVACFRQLLTTAECDYLMAWPRPCYTLR